MCKVSNLLLTDESAGPALTPDHSPCNSSFSVLRSPFRSPFFVLRSALLRSVRAVAGSELLTEASTAGEPGLCMKETEPPAAGNILFMRTTSQIYPPFLTDFLLD
jgi:hypothetical protein